MWLARLLQRLSLLRRTPKLTGQALLIAEGQAFTDAEDMIRRLGVRRAHLIAFVHAEAEREGIGADLFPPGHWRRVCEDIRRTMRDKPP